MHAFGALLGDACTRRHLLFDAFDLASGGQGPAHTRDRNRTLERVLGTQPKAPHRYTSQGDNRDRCSKVVVDVYYKLGERQATNQKVKEAAVATAATNDFF